MKYDSRVNPTCVIAAMFQSRIVQSDKVRSWRLFRRRKASGMRVNRTEDKARVVNVSAESAKASSSITSRGVKMKDRSVRFAGKLPEVTLVIKLPCG